MIKAGTIVEKKTTAGSRATVVGVTSGDRVTGITAIPVDVDQGRSSCCTTF